MGLRHPRPQTEHPLVMGCGLGQASHSEQRAGESKPLLDQLRIDPERFRVLRGRFRVPPLPHQRIGPAFPRRNVP